jgi:hypothetical protein
LKACGFIFTGFFIKFNFEKARNRQSIFLKESVDGIGYIIKKSI